MAYIRITQVDAVLLLDENGDRIAVKYYPQHCSVPGSDDGSNSCKWFHVVLCPYVTISVGEFGEAKGARTRLDEGAKFRRRQRYLKHVTKEHHVQRETPAAVL